MRSKVSFVTVLMCKAGWQIYRWVDFPVLLTLVLAVLHNRILFLLYYTIGAICVRLVETNRDHHPAGLADCSILYTSLSLIETISFQKEEGRIQHLRIE